MTDEEQTEETPEATPLEKLAAAVQEFASATGDHPGMVTSALVAWETVTYTDDGRPLFSLDYASAGVNESMTAAIGLAAYANRKMLVDLVDGTEDREDDVG
jgi:hypothetical protein